MKIEIDFFLGGGHIWWTLLLPLGLPMDVLLLGVVPSLASLTREGSVNDFVVICFMGWGAGLAYALVSSGGVVSGLRPLEMLKVRIR